MAKEAIPADKDWTPDILGQLASGETVIDREESHLHGDIRMLLPEVFKGIESNNEEVVIRTIDLGRTVGENICLETDSNDDIVYAQRPGRTGLTRFVKNREPEASSLVTIILHKDTSADSQYSCRTAFVGPLAELEVWQSQSEESKEFWDTHALLWGKETIIPGTETTEKPW